MKSTRQHCFTALFEVQNNIQTTSMFENCNKLDIFMITITEIDEEINKNLCRTVELK